MNPRAENPKTSFSNLELEAYTFEQIYCTKVYTKLKGLSNGVCLILCFLVKQVGNQQKLKFSF